MLYSKPKRDKITTAKTYAWGWFSKYIRLRDCLRTTNTRTHGRCITCGKIYPFQNLQAGHFIPGRHNAVLYSEEGVNAQCYRCNGPLKSNPREYDRVMRERFGDEFVEKMDADSKMVVPMSALEHREIGQRYKALYISLFA